MLASNPPSPHLDNAGHTSAMGRRRGGSVAAYSPTSLPPTHPLDLLSHRHHVTMTLLLHNCLYLAIVGFNKLFPKITMSYGFLFQIELKWENLLRSSLAKDPPSV